MIPKRVRDSLGIRPGDEVVVEQQDGEARIRRLPPLGALRGMLAGGPSLTAALEQEHREELEREDHREAEWTRRRREQGR